MAKKLTATKAGVPEKVNAEKGRRKRTKSVEIELSRLKVLVEEKPDDAEELVKKTKKKVERNSESSLEDIELTPMTLVIAANAILLERYNKNSDEITPYEANIDANIDENVETAMGGLLIDMNQLLKNYRDEIKELNRLHEERRKIFKKIPEASQAFKKGVKKVLEVSSGIGIGALAMKIVYNLSHNYIGQWPAIGAGAVAGGSILFMLSWKGAEFLSSLLIHADTVRNYLRKKLTQFYYSWKKAEKLKMNARALNSAMSETYGKDYEIDYKLIKNIGRTVPSPFEIKKEN